MEPHSAPCREGSSCAGEYLRASSWQRRTIAELLRLEWALKCSAEQVLARSGSVSRSCDGGSPRHPHAADVDTRRQSSATSEPASPAPLLQPTPRHKMQKSARPPVKAKKVQTPVTQRAKPIPSDLDVSSVSTPAARRPSTELTTIDGNGIATQNTTHHSSDEDSSREAMASAALSKTAPAAVLAALQRLRQHLTHHESGQSVMCHTDAARFRAAVCDGVEDRLPSASSRGSLGTPFLRAGESTPTATTAPRARASSGGSGVAALSRVSSIASGYSSTVATTGVKTRGGACGGFTPHVGARVSPRALDTTPLNSVALTLEAAAAGPLCVGGDGARQSEGEKALLAVERRKGGRSLLPLIRMGQPWTLRTSACFPATEERGGQDGQESDRTRREAAADATHGAPFTAHVLTTDRFYECLSAWSFLSAHTAVAVADAALYHSRCGDAGENEGTCQGDSSCVRAGEEKGCGGDGDARDGQSTKVPKLDYRSALIHNLPRKGETAGNALPHPPSALSSSSLSSTSEGKAKTAVTRRVMAVYPAGLPITLAREGMRCRFEEQSRPATQPPADAAEDSTRLSSEMLPHAYAHVCATLHDIRVVDDTSELSLSHPQPNQPGQHESHAPPSSPPSSSLPGVYERLDRRRRGIAEFNRSGYLSASVLRALLNDALVAALARAPVCPTLDELIEGVEAAAEEARLAQLRQPREETCAGQSLSEGVASGEAKDDDEGGWRKLRTAAPHRYRAGHALNLGHAHDASAPSGHHWMREEGEAKEPSVSTIQHARPFDILGFTVEVGARGQTAEPPTATETRGGEESEGGGETSARTVDLVITVLARVRPHNVAHSLSSPTHAQPPSGEATTDDAQRTDGRDGSAPAMHAPRLAVFAQAGAALAGSDNFLVPEAVGRSIAFELFPAEFLLSPRTSTSFTVTPLTLDSVDSEDSPTTTAVSLDGDSSWTECGGEVAEEEETVPTLKAARLGPQQPARPVPPEALIADVDPAPVEETAGAPTAWEQLSHPLTPWDAAEAAHNTDSARAEKEGAGAAAPAQEPPRIAWSIAAHTQTLDAAVERFCAARRRQHDTLATFTADWGVPAPATHAVSASATSGAGKRGGGKGRGRADACIALLRELATAPGVVAALASEGLPEDALTLETPVYAFRSSNSSSRSTTAWQLPSRADDGSHENEAESEERPGASFLAAVDAAGFYSLWRDHSLAHVQALLASGGAAEGAEAILERVADAFREHAVAVDGLPSEERRKTGKGKRSAGGIHALFPSAVAAAVPSVDLLPAFHLFSSAGGRKDALASRITLYVQSKGAIASLEEVVHEATQALHAAAVATEAVNKELRRHGHHDWRKVFLPAVVERYKARREAVEELAVLEADAARALAAVRGAPVEEHVEEEAQEEGEEVPSSATEVRKAQAPEPEPHLPTPPVAAAESRTNGPARKDRDIPESQPSPPAVVPSARPSSSLSAGPKEQKPAARHMKKPPPPPPPSSPSSPASSRKSMKRDGTDTAKRTTALPTTAASSPQALPSSSAWASSSASQETSGAAPRTVAALFTAAADFATHVRAVTSLSTRTLTSFVVVLAVLGALLAVIGSDPRSDHHFH